MAELDRDRVYALTADEHAALQAHFAADYCDGVQGKAYIKEAFAGGYLMDPHTATCFKAYESRATSYNFV